MRLWLLSSVAIAVFALGCSERAAESPTPSGVADAVVEESVSKTSPAAVERTFVVRLLSPAEAAGAPPTDDARRESLQATIGFSDVVLSRPKDPDDQIALVELTVWGSQADASRAAKSMSGTVGVYEVMMRIGEGGPPVFRRPLDMVLFESVNVTEPFFRAEVEVFARVSERSPGFAGLLLKNVEENAEIPFIYLAQWGSQEAREEIHNSEGFAAARGLASHQKTEVMKFLELQRVD